MATTVFSMFLLSLVLCASFSLTVPLGAKIVDFSDSVREHEEESTPAVLDPHHLPKEDTKFVVSLTSDDAFPSEDLGEGEQSRRVKRDVFNTKEKCAADMVEYAGRCWTQKQYKKLTEED